MKRKITAKADSAGIASVTADVQEFLTQYDVKGKEKMRAVLAAEECAGSLVNHATEGSSINIFIRAFLGRVTIEMSAPGDEYDLSKSADDAGILSDETEDVQEVLRNIVLKSTSEGLKYSHKNGINHIRMTVVRSHREFLYRTLGAMFLAVIAGILLSLLHNSTIPSFLDQNLLSPISKMYLNALKMVVAPVVFFSIVSCIVQFSDLSELGRVGGKIIGMYLLTTFIAVGVGIGAYYLFRPGCVSVASTLTDAGTVVNESVNISLRDTIVGIVPSNFIQPFLDADMLQLIFLAVLCGVGTGMIGRYSEMLKDIFSALNDLFLQITTIIIRFMPIAVFCSICSMVLKMGLNTLLDVLAMFGTFIAGLLIMMVVYCLLIALVAKISPIPLIRKYASRMLQIFSMASSNASIPINMEACEDLGIEKKIYSLSIPLGATLNMDGSCIYLAVFALALAKAYGVPVTGASMLGMIVSIVVLSMGAPGIPGSGLICLSVLLTQMNVPAAAIGLVMGIDSLVGMFRTMNNCLGDVAVSTIVAKKENALDMDKYREK